MTKFLYQCSHKCRGYLEVLLCRTVNIQNVRNAESQPTDATKSKMCSAAGMKG